MEGWGRDRAGNGRVEGGAVYKAITKFTDATSVCVSCSYCLASYIRILLWCVGTKCSQC